MVTTVSRTTIFSELQQVALEEGIYKHLARGIIEVDGKLLMLRRPASKNPEKNRTLEHPGGKAEIFYPSVHGIPISEIIFPASTPQYREGLFPGIDVIQLILDRHIEPVGKTVVREVTEETGQVVTLIGPLVHVEDFVDKNGVLSREFTFEVEVAQPMTPIALTEHPSYLWVPRHVSRAQRASHAFWESRAAQAEEPSVGQA